MAPEVLMGNEYTTQSDVYSYGIILWQIFARELPYSDINPHCVARRVAEDAFRPTKPSNLPKVS